MKENKGITMVTLIITIILLLILAGISIGTGNKIIESSKLENLKTNMLLIKIKGKENVENANFKLGTNFETATDKNTRVETAKSELKGEEITDSSIFNGNINITQEDISTSNEENIYYYKLTTQNLVDMGLSNVKSNHDKGWYIIKYDIKNIETEVYNTQGFEKDGKKYYSLNELQSLDIDL